jgi:glycerol kinase
VEAANADADQPLTALRVDGGMARNAWFLQNQADLLGLPVLQAAVSESTAQGAAFLAGLRAGVWPNLDALRGLLHDAHRFEPQSSVAERARRLELWRKAVHAVIRYYKDTTS